MNKYKYILYILILLICNGCIAAFVAGGAAVGTIAVSQDFATTSMDTNFNHAWKIANAQLKKMGDVDESYQKLGEIKAKVQNSEVKIKISRLTDRTVDIKVSARKNLLPNVELAQAILANIIRNIKE